VLTHNPVFLHQEAFYDPHCLNSQDRFPAMSNGSQSSPLVSALGTLIGYISAEAAVEDVFDRLLWPQRFFNAVTWRDSLQVGLLTPMGGPIHKAALTTLDKFHRNGIFKGRDLGNMLGTAFYQNTHFKYKIHDSLPGSPGKEYARNGLWVQAVSRIPVTSKRKGEQHIEKGEQKTLLVRAKSSVNILELSYAPPDENIDSAKVVKNDTGPITFHTILTLIWSEITSILTGAIVLAVWRSPSSLLWFFPLLLKVLSATFALEREGILPPESGKSVQQQPTRRFEVNLQGNGFLIIEGQESTVMQFFRHYGHPIRNRLRETIQVTIVVALGLIFPLGLICSLLWMPAGLQYVWLSYQLYATIALYVARYTKGYQWHTTDARLAQTFAESEQRGGECVAYLQDEKGTTVVGRLTRIPIRRYQEGQDFVRNYLATRATLWESDDKGDGDLDEKLPVPS